MNFYELIYLNIYLSLSRTNKSIPEWSTLFCLSSLFICNLLSILLLLNIEIKGFEKTQVYVFLGIIFGAHYLYFQNGNRIIKKITKLKPKVNLTNRILTILYVFGTISLFCYLADIGLKIYLITIIGISATIISAHYFFGKRNE
ncbi:hypothetical protein [Winogradskyella helgolandensis]|uniref:hypothetical protein n=1 Tax=Winogradskyella helgolandensis TaxID=2697010 RepID=UPI0015C12720|nr:hypothetical protein [Winogradskyella helgolandensis]